MKKDIIICIGTVGSPTFDKCYSNIKRLQSIDSRIKKVCVIENVKPQYAWLNHMITESQSNTWCLQVDEDMYLNDKAISTLLKIAAKKESHGIGVGLAHGMLWDLFLDQPVGSLKLWRSKILRKFEFKDVLGSDRGVVEGIVKRGYKIASTSDILGEHDSAPTIEIAKKKYYEYIHKIRKFNGEEDAKKFISFLKRNNKDQSIISSAEQAMIESIVNKSKE